MLKPNQNQLILALLETGSIKAACEQVNITRQTYYNWLQNEEFVEKLKEREESLSNNSIFSMKNLFIKAVENYGNLLDNDNDDIKFKITSAVIKDIGKIIGADNFEHKRWCRSRGYG